MPRRTKRPTPRIEDPDTSVIILHDTDIPLPSPYDGRPNQRAFDVWEFRVTLYFKCAKLSDHEAMWRNTHTRGDVDVSSSCRWEGVGVLYDKIYPYQLPTAKRMVTQRSLQSPPEGVFSP